MELQDFAQEDVRKPGPGSFADALPKEIVEQVKNNPGIKQATLIRWLETEGYAATRANVATLLYRIKNGTI